MKKKNKVKKIHHKNSALLNSSHYRFTFSYKKTTLFTERQIQVLPVMYINTSYTTMIYMSLGESEVKKGKN